MEGEPRSVAFGGLRLGYANENALLTVVGPRAIAAAVAALDLQSRRPGRSAGERNHRARMREPDAIAPRSAQLVIVNH